MAEKPHSQHQRPATQNAFGRQTAANSDHGSSSTILSAERKVPAVPGMASTSTSASASASFPVSASASFPVSASASFSASASTSARPPDWKRSDSNDTTKRGSKAPRRTSDGLQRLKDEETNRKSTTENDEQNACDRRADDLGAANNNHDNRPGAYPQRGRAVGSAPAWARRRPPPPRRETAPIPSEEDETTIHARVEPVADDSTTTTNNKHCNKMRWILVAAVLLFVVVAAVGATLGILMSSSSSSSGEEEIEIEEDSNDDDDDDDENKDDPLSPRSQHLRDAFFEISGPAVYEESSYQSMAIEWLLRNDYLSQHDDVQVFYVLAALYFSTAGDQWKDSLGFLSNSTFFCEWNDGVAKGVFCDEFGAVTKLQLANNRLKGVIAYEIGSIETLKEISLAGNSLNGTIPLMMMMHHNNNTSSSLTKFDISHNIITGTIHPVIFANNYFPNLHLLRLRDNPINGTIPSEIGVMTSLQLFDATKTLLSGTVPSELWNLPRLLDLFLSENRRLSGSIVSLPTRFRELDLSFSNFSGTIPTEIGILSDLTRLALSSNQFSGLIPSEIGRLSHLRELRLDDNELRGTLPTTMGNMTRLERASFWKNFLEGPIPSLLGSLSDLEYLNLQQNQFTIEANTMETIFCNNNELILVFVDDCINLCSCCTCDRQNL